ncbi:MAG: Gfo/Idh/MocA family oxidoreductase [Kiritimatiellae bacterium]|nr:Gfo/Idh/MocA family oxidoreductase [Kiritimatiellia bacterium]
MKRERKLRVGIIGTGGISRGQHIPGWQAVSGAEIVAVCDINEAAAKKAGADFNVPNVFTDFKDLVGMKAIDVVDVCTPNKVHTPAVLAALNAGKHVICEKPLAVTVKEIKQMAAAAKRKRRKLMTAQHMRFGGLSQALKKFVDGGEVGEPYHAVVHALRRNTLPAWGGFIDKDLSGGGPCMDIGVHALDLCMWLMGCPKPVRISGSAKVNFAKGYDIPGGWGEWDRKRFSVEDWAAGFVVFDTGATLSLESSWLGHHEAKGDMSCLIYGKKATLQYPSGKYATHKNGAFLTGVIEPAPEKKRAHAAEIEAFFQCVVDGKPSPVPVEETMRVIAVLEGIYQSEQTGREVRVRL